MRAILFLLNYLVVAAVAVGQTHADSQLLNVLDTEITMNPALQRSHMRGSGLNLVPDPKDSVNTLDQYFKLGHRGYFSYHDVLRQNAGYNFFAKPQEVVSDKRKAFGKETLFYLLSGLLFFFAIIKLLFNKYVNNLVSLVFRGSLKQKQIREQLLQTPLPSLLLNVLFVIVAGLYVSFLLKHFGFALETNFWLLVLYCSTVVGCIYLVKFLVLKFTGWIFNMRDAADTYLFIVFLVNKLLGIFLLPLLILMAFAATWTAALYTISYVLVIVFFAYRYIISFAPVRREVKVSQFHFFMYLCAFEVIPLLLIYKVLLKFL